MASAPTGVRSRGRLGVLGREGQHQLLWWTMCLFPQSAELELGRAREPRRGRASLVESPEGSCRVAKSPDRVLVVESPANVES